MIVNVHTHGTLRDDGYLISVTEEIRRVLSTKRGSIPMNPQYGSDLYLYRDRTLDGVTRLGIIAESFAAIERSVRRVKPTRVRISSAADGAFALNIDVEAAHAA